MNNRRNPSLLIEAARAGDRVSLGRLVSLASEFSAASDELDRLVKNQLPQHVIGITGAPGAGKSTLTDQLVCQLRKQSLTVAVLAVDPSSQITGGAILGDRVRMNQHALDPHVYIRSLATRGASGGLAAVVPTSLRVLGAVGFDVVILETVGVGQIELDVAHIADTVAVVVNPGWGDEVQAIKAGVMEIADVFVVNKSDKDGAAQTEADLRGAIAIREKSAFWEVPIVLTNALTNDGVEAFSQQLCLHHEASSAAGEFARRRTAHSQRELMMRIHDTFARRAAEVSESPAFQDLAHRVNDGEISVSDAVSSLLGP